MRTRTTGVVASLAALLVTGIVGYSVAAPGDGQPPRPAAAPPPINQTAPPPARQGAGGPGGQGARGFGPGGGRAGGFGAAAGPGGPGRGGFGGGGPAVQNLSNQISQLTDQVLRSPRPGSTTPANDVPPARPRRPVRQRPRPSFRRPRRHGPGYGPRNGWQGPRRYGRRQGRAAVSAAAWAPAPKITSVPVVVLEAVPAALVPRVTSVPTTVPVPKATSAPAPKAVPASAANPAPLSAQ